MSIFFCGITVGDKCWREQACYPFENHIQLAEEMGAKRRNQTSNIYDTRKIYDKNCVYALLLNIVIMGHEFLNNRHFIDLPI